MTAIVARLVQSRRRGLSVRMQFFLALSTIVGAFALGVGILVVDRVEARAEKLALAAAGEEAHTIATLIRSELERTGAEFAELAAQLESNAPPVQDFPAIDRMGLELLSAEGKLLFPRQGVSRAREEGAVFVDAPLLLRSKLSGVVRVVKPTIVVQALLADFAPTVLVISLVLGAAAAAAAAWIGQTIAAPIEALSLYSQRVSEGERPALPRAVVGREVARLSRSIETMRERLEGRPFVETFASDLSHEMKNPVAAIRASAEVLQEGALDEPEQAARFVMRIHQAAARMEKLLADLLSLAEIETRGPEHLDEVELAELLRDLVATREEGQERISLSCNGTGIIKGDRGWLTRAFSNLIENCLLHSAPASRVHIVLDELGDEVQIRSENPGQLQKHVRDSLFRRFVTTRREQGGTGLGLSIVRAVMEAHGGYAELADGGPPQVSFVLRLPMVTPPLSSTGRRTRRNGAGLGG